MVLLFILCRAHKAEVTRIILHTLSSSCQHRAEAPTIITAGRQLGDSRYQRCELLHHDLPKALIKSCL